MSLFRSIEWAGNGGWRNRRRTELVAVKMVYAKVVTTTMSGDLDQMLGRLLDSVFSPTLSPGRVG